MIFLGSLHSVRFLSEFFTVARVRCVGSVCGFLCGFLGATGASGRPVSLVWPSIGQAGFSGVFPVPVKD